jgi:hypothetical protein
MANADGGYLIIGAAQDKKTEQCSGFKSVGIANPIFSKIEDMAAHHIFDRLTVEPVRRSSSAGAQVVVAHIPDSEKLLAVHNNGGAEYWKRVGRRKVRLGHAEIEAAMLAGFSAQTEAQKRQEKLAGDETRWNEIQDPTFFSGLMDKRFEDSVGSARYLRLTYTPESLKDGAVNSADVDLRRFVWFPPSDPAAGQRQNGWHLGIGAGHNNPLVSTALGLESKDLRDKKDPVPGICLTRSGHLEFWVPLSSDGSVSAKRWKNFANALFFGRSQ